MHKPIIFNRYLNSKWNVASNLLMKEKLETVKPKVNIKCPESFSFYKNTFHKLCNKDPESKFYLYNRK